MKLYFILFGVCLVQICSGIYSGLNMNIKPIRYGKHNLMGVSEQFEIEIFQILRADLDNIFVSIWVDQFVLDLAKMSNEGNSTIDVDIVKKHSESLSQYLSIENVKVLQMILLKNFGKESFNGVINLMYATRPNAPSAEIQNALDYLYGIQTEAPFIAIPDMTIADCPNPETVVNYKSVIKQLNTMIGIKSKVVQDFHAIYMKFPCNEIIPKFLEWTMDILIHHLHGDKLPIDVCTIKNSDIAQRWANDTNIDELEQMVTSIHAVKSVLSTRLSDDFRGIADFINAFRPDTTDDGIQKRLKYFYGRVPKPISPCSGSNVV